MPLSTATVSMVHSVPELMVSSEVSLSLSCFTCVHPAPPAPPWHLECPGTSRALSNGAFVKLYLLPPALGLCPLVWNIQGTTGWDQTRGLAVLATPSPSESGLSKMRLESVSGSPDHSGPLWDLLVRSMWSLGVRTRHWLCRSFASSLQSLHGRYYPVLCWVIPETILCGKASTKSLPGSCGAVRRQRVGEAAPR